MAPTPTPRLGLLKPDAADLYDVGIDNGNMDKLDRVGGLTFCTSVTRPVDPFDGMEIYETDTSLHYAWQAGSPGEWVQITSGSIIGQRYDFPNNTLTTMVNNTTEQLTGMGTGALVIPPNRSVLVRAYVEYDDVTNGILTWRIRTNDLAGGAWGTKRGRPQVASADRQHEMIEAYVAVGVSGFSGQYVLTAQRAATNATVPRIYRSNVGRPFMYAEVKGHSSRMIIV